MNDTINRIRTIQELCAVVEGELIESGHPLFAGQAAALYDLAMALERSLRRLGDTVTSTDSWTPRVTFEEG